MPSWGGIISGAITHLKIVTKSHEPSSRVRGLEFNPILGIQGLLGEPNNHKGNGCSQNHHFLGKDPNH